MKIIGSKLLEVIKLKQVLVLILFASLLFPQSNINQIVHPLDENSPTLRDQDKSYLVINSDSHFEIPNMLFFFWARFARRYKCIVFALLRGILRCVSMIFLSAREARPEKIAYLEFQIRNFNFKIGIILIHNSKLK